MRKLLFVILIIAWFGNGFAQNSPVKVLFILPDSTKFYSNSFYIKDLAYMLDVKPEKVFIPYLQNIERELIPYEYENFEYISCAQQSLKKWHKEALYQTVQNDEGEEYLGVMPVSENSTLQAMIQDHGASFVLFVNLYEILSDEMIKYYGEKVTHVIHFDLFNSSLALIKGGKYLAITEEFLPESMEWFYKDFALNNLFFCKAWKKDSLNLSKAYQEEAISFEKKTFGFSKKKAIGVLFGTGMPYGGIGLEFNYNINHFWDINAGAGRDFSGFKVGLGARYYVLGYSKIVKPFVGLNYGFASGNQVILGAERDQYGKIINPEKAGRYKIHADHALYLRSGLNILSKSGLYVVPSLGYAYPFLRTKPSLLEGEENEIRNKVTNFLAVGGIDIGIGFYYYW